MNHLYSEMFTADARRHDDNVRLFWNPLRLNAARQIGKNTLLRAFSEYQMSVNRHADEILAVYSVMDLIKSTHNIGCMITQAESGKVVTTDTYLASELRRKFSKMPSSDYFREFARSASFSSRYGSDTVWAYINEYSFKPVESPHIQGTPKTAATLWIKDDGHTIADTFRTKVTTESVAKILAGFIRKQQRFMIDFFTTESCFRLPGNYYTQGTMHSPLPVFRQFA